MTRSCPVCPRWIFLVGVFVAGLVLLTGRFDTMVLAEAPDRWVRFAPYISVLIRIGLAALAAFVLIAFPRLGAIAREAQQSALEHRWLPWLLLHGIAVAGYFHLTAALLDAAAQHLYPSGTQLAAWATLGGVVVGLWLLAMAPFRFWRWLAARERMALLVAISTGTLAWGLGEFIILKLWRFIAAGTFWLSKALLGLLYEDVLYDRVDHVLGTARFLVTINPQCSGYEGIGLITAFLALYLWIFRGGMRFPQALLLFPLGALVIWVANSIRIALLIALGTSFSKDIALGGFHSQAGWIAFSVVALGLIGLTGRMRLFVRNPPDEHAGPAAAMEAYPAVEALLVPLLVLIAAVMLTSALSHGFDWLYPLRPIVTAAALWHYRRVYREWDWNWSWPALIIGCAVFAVWLALERNSDGSTLASAMASLPAAQKSGWLAFRVFGSVIIVPLAEELAFRGYLLRRLGQRHFDHAAPIRFTWLSFLGSSLAFGLVHGRWLAGTLAGMAYAGTLYRNGKLGDAVVAHMATNALIAFYVIAFGEWQLWS